MKTREQLTQIELRELERLEREVEVAEKREETFKEINPFLLHPFWLFILFMALFIPTGFFIYEVVHKLLLPH